MGDVLGAQTTNTNPITGYQGTGTWGPQTGVFGLINPFSRDVGFTEMYAKPGQKNIWGGELYNPAAAAPTGVTYNPAGVLGGYKPPPATTTPPPSGNGGGGAAPPPAPISTGQPGQDAIANDKRYQELKAIADMGALNPVQATEWADWVSRFKAAYQPSYAEQQQGIINSGWNTYEQQLNSLLTNNLPQWMREQQGTVQQTGELAKQNAATQKAISEQDVQTQLTGSLRDLGSNIKNLFQSGNVYLGARGAGDSSAADMYTFALTKMGTKERSRIKSQAEQTLQQIGNVYNSELNRINSDVATQMGAISNWFNQAQMDLKTRLAQAGQGRASDLANLSTSLYNQALQALQNVQSQAANNKSMLTQWALNNSKTTQEAISKIQTIEQTMPSLASTTVGGGPPSYNALAPQALATGAGSTSETGKQLVGIDPSTGQPIYA